MGRQYYKNNIGGKHSIKSAGKAYSWWQYLCEPSNTRERQQVKREIAKEIVEL